MTEEKFYDLLEEHDWYFMNYLPDRYNSSIYDSGLKEQQNLLRLMDEDDSGDFEHLYHQYASYMFSGIVTGTKKIEKPARPSERFR